MPTASRARSAHLYDIRVPPEIRTVDLETIRVSDFGLSAAAARAENAGNPDPAFNDLAGTRNDLGFSGGPRALQ